MPELWIRCCLLFQMFNYIYGSSDGQYVARPVCFHTYGSTISSVTAVKSLIGCATICHMEKECSSALYDPSIGQCVTNENTSQHNVDTSECSLVVTYVAIVKRLCATDAECTTPVNSECAGGYCQCINGYGLNPSEGTCTPFCSIYGNTFRLFQRTDLSGANNMHKYGTLDDCKVACFEATTFVCRSVEYKATWNLCYLSNETAFTLPDSVQRDVTGWVLLHRNCA